MRISRRARYIGSSPPSSDARRNSRAPPADRSRAPICAAPRSGCSGRPATCRRSARAAAGPPAAAPASNISPFAGGAPHLLGQRQRGAAVAVGHADAARPRASSSSGSVRPSASSARASSSSSASGDERLEDEHGGAREQRGVQLEGRVLGRRADQRDGAVLHDRQEGILLRAVEAMDLVDEEQRPLPDLPARRAPARRSSSARRRRNGWRRSAGNAGRSRRRAAARPSSCRCPAAPRRRASRRCRVCSMRVSVPSGPSRCSCPATSESRVGRSRSASGRGAASASPAASNRLLIPRSRCWRPARRG